MKESYRICSKTVMDTSDPEISFDDHGISNHYYNFVQNILPNWHPNEHGKYILDSTIQSIKNSSSKHSYNCILGLSGGLDSSYLLHKVVTEFGLKPLVFHVDAGWNTDTSVHNINCLIDSLGLDLFTEVINWDEMRRFQLAMFRSGLPHLDIPQDMAFISVLYKFASKYNIKYILNGGNIATESILMPLSILYWGTDMRHVNHILNNFLDGELPTFPFSSVFYHKFYLRFIKQIKVVKPLNLLPFNKVDAINELSTLYGWRPYPQKHFESSFTRFLEGHWLPSRFNYDMRRNQFSSLILSGQLSRSSALSALEKPSLSPKSISSEYEYIASKLSISTDELIHFHKLPLKYYWDYKNSYRLFSLGESVLSRLLKTQRGGAF